MGASGSSTNNSSSSGSNAQDAMATVAGRKYERNVLLNNKLNTILNSDKEKQRKYNEALDEIYNKYFSGEMSNQEKELELTKLDEEYNLGPVLNPNYNPDNPMTSRNCAMCSFAGWATQEGYDVIAGDARGRWYGPRSVLDLKFDKNNYITSAITDSGKLRYTCDTESLSDKQLQDILMNPNSFSMDNMDMGDKIVDFMSQKPNNTLAELNVAWNAGSAHSVCIYNHDGNVYYVDFQTNKHYNLSTEKGQDDFYSNISSRVQPGAAELQVLTGAKLKKDVTTDTLSKMIKPRKK